MNIHTLIHIYGRSKHLFFISIFLSLLLGLLPHDTMTVAAILLRETAQNVAEFLQSNKLTELISSK